MEEFLDSADIELQERRLEMKLIQIFLVIPIETMRGQAYDGGHGIGKSRMSGTDLNLYTHCRSHALNLDIAST